MAIFWKTPGVAKEELRLEELRRLYENGDINAGEYMEAINRLKRAGGTDMARPGVLDTIQLVVLLALIGAGIYVYRDIRRYY